jgi:hypothetical protein
VRANDQTNSAPRHCFNFGDWFIVKSVTVHLQNGIKCSSKETHLCPPMKKKRMKIMAAHNLHTLVSLRVSSSLSLINKTGS